MPIIESRNKKEKKVYWDKAEAALLKAWITILIAEAESAVATFVASELPDPEGWRAKQVQHWQGVSSGLKLAYSRVDEGIPAKLFEKATRMVLDMDQPAQ